MTAPWFRLQADFYLDRDLRRAGPEARLCWPFVLCVVKQCRGVADDAALDPFTFADLIGGDVAMWETGIASLKTVGLLVEWSGDVHRGRGKYDAVSGWRARSWDKFQPDSRPKGSTRTVPNGPERSQGPNGTDQTVPNGPIRPVTVSVSSETLPVTEQPPLIPQKAQKAQKAKPSRRRRDAVTLDALWQDLSGARPRKGTAAERKRLARWERFLKDFDVDELSTLLRSLAANEWWRGGNRDGKDLFREGPAKFLNDPEKVEAGIASASQGLGKDAWLKEWRGAFSAFVSDVGRKTRRGGRESFLEWLRTHDSRAFPVPDEVLEAVDRRTGEAA